MSTALSKSAHLPTALPEIALDGALALSTGEHAALLEINLRLGLLLRQALLAIQHGPQAQVGERLALMRRTLYGLCEEAPGLARPEVLRELEARLDLVHGVLEAAARGEPLAQTQEAGALRRPGPGA